MKITESRIKEVKVLEPQVYTDSRGYFFEAFRASVFAGIEADISFVQDNISKSVKNVIRGLHYQIINPQDKLVTCLQGTILDVAVDLRRNSDTFGQHVAVELSDANKKMLFVPKGFAHGFSVLSEEVVVSYKCSNYYTPEGERGICWNDKALGIDWQVSSPVLSEKDRNLPELSLIKKEDLF